jgi:hypothetical protein
LKQEFVFEMASVMGGLIGGRIAVDPQWWSKIVWLGL